MNKEGLRILIAHSHLFSAFPALLRRERINLLALEYIRRIGLHKTQLNPH